MPPVVDARPTPMRRRSATLILGWATVAALLALGLFGPAAVVADAPGNNGTVKIHDTATDKEPIVANQPHVCDFHLHFFFGDGAQTGNWWISSWAPTGDGSTVLSGSYTAGADGKVRVPDSASISLPDGHYKLNWDGRNDQNVKHKVFWVACAAPSESPAPSESAAPSEEPSPSESAAPSEEPSPSESAAPSESVEPSPSESAVESPSPAAAAELNTDAQSASDARPVFLVLAGLLAVLLFLAPASPWSPAHWFRRRRS